MVMMAGQVGAASCVREQVGSMNSTNVTNPSMRRERDRAGKLAGVRDVPGKGFVRDDTAGDAVERYVYDAYGTVTIYDDDWSDTRSESSYDNSILYCGYYRDAETHLDCVRHRYRHPYLGWIQREPGGEYRDGMSLYEYVGSNPLRFLDPLGAESSCITREEALKRAAWHWKERAKYWWWSRWDIANKGRGKQYRYNKNQYEKHRDYARWWEDQALDMCDKEGEKRGKVERLGASLSPTQDPDEYDWTTAKGIPIVAVGGAMLSATEKPSDYFSTSDFLELAGKAALQFRDATTALHYFYLWGYIKCYECKCDEERNQLRWQLVSEGWSIGPGLLKNAGVKGRWRSEIGNPFIFKMFMTKVNSETPDWISEICGTDAE